MEKEDGAGIIIPEVTKLAEDWVAKPSRKELDALDFKTGSGGGIAPKDARKDGKPRPSLLPMDILIEFLLPAYEEGLIKYEKESWRRGFKVSELMDAADRHKSAFFHECEDYDIAALDENGITKHHLAGAIFSLISVLHTLKYHPELDDRREIIHGNKYVKNNGV